MFIKETVLMLPLKAEFDVKLFNICHELAVSSIAASKNVHNKSLSFFISNLVRNTLK